MLKIIKSGFTALGRERIKARIGELVRDGRRAFLIVPEQETVAAENEMSRELPDSAPLFFEVTNFTRFANTTFRALGGVSGEYCDRGRRALVMWRTLAELAPVLNLTGGRREISASLVDRALAAVTEIESLGVTAGELIMGAADDSIREDVRLAGKLSDLGQIAVMYKDLLTERYSDTASDVEAMLARLGERPDFLSDAQIFVEGFTSFTESQYRLIGELSARTDVTVHLTIPKSRPEAFEYEEVRAAESRLKIAARRRGADVNVKFEDGRENTASEALSRISDILYMNSTDERVEIEGDELRIVEAETPFDECEFIAADIRRRVIEDGARYSDFAVIARSADSYRGILDSALARAEVPAFTSGGRDLTELEAIKMISTAYAAVCHGFRREDVVTYAKCGFCGVSREACDEFEMYVNLWQITGRGFSELGVWSMNPLGYTTQRPDGTDERLLRINATRDAIIRPLVAFRDRLREIKTVREHAEALYGFLTEIGLESGLRERVRLLESVGEQEAAEENGRLWRLIVTCLDTVVEVLGDTETDADSFPRQLEALFSTSSISRIPASRDAVTVGSADMLRLYGKKHVYMIGVLDGEFPATVSDSSFFSERDKERLAELGLAIRPELATKSARELFIFLRSFTYARESVTLTYPALSSKFKRVRRASEIDRITELTNGTVKTAKTSEIATRGRLWSSDAALLALGELSGDERLAVRDALVRCGRGDAVAVSEGDIRNTDLALGESIVGKAYGRRLALTQTMIDRYVGCPLDYFCRFTVKLAPEERAELDARGIGSFIHAILESFFATVRAEGLRAGELTAVERKAMTARAAESYLSSLGETLGDVRTEMKLRRLCRAAMPVVDGLCREFAESEFTPRFFELRIKDGRGDNPAPVSFKTDDGDEIFVYGTLDRADVYERDGKVYLRVVDYKTGSKDFSPEDLEEGRNLQMFLYLKALTETEKPDFRASIGLGDGERALPAGVIYVRTTVDDVKLEAPSEEAEREALDRSQVRSGMVIDDDEIIEAMGVRFTPVGTPDGKINPKAAALRYDAAGWERLMQTVENSVISVAKGIKSGRLPASPALTGKRSSCEYCDYKPICRQVKVK